MEMNKQPARDPDDIRELIFNFHFACRLFLLLFNEYYVIVLERICTYDILLHRPMYIANQKVIFFILPLNSNISGTRTLNYLLFFGSFSSKKKQHLQR